MIARLRSLGPKAFRIWINWTSFKLGAFVGVIIGMLVMALAMAALTSSPQAAAVLRAKVEALR